MKGTVLQPFRAPRSRGEKTEVRVHRKDNSARFKEMERWMDKNLTGEGVAVTAREANEGSPANAREANKAVCNTSDEEDNLPIHTTIIPKRKGIKLMSEREANEMAQFGEVQRWSSDSEGDDEIIAKTIQTQAIPTIPEGQEAVGSGIARDFGKDMEVFKGKVMHVQAVRRRIIYHVEYETETVKTLT